MGTDFAAADAQVRSLTDGQFFLRAEGHQVYLVKAATGERVVVPHRQPVNGNGHILSQVDRLSERERQLFVMLGEGIGMNEIAGRMNVSVKTVETFRARLKQKLGVEKRAQLLALAVEWRLNNA